MVTTMSKKTTRSDSGFYGHPEDNVYGKTKGVNFMDDELRESAIRSGIKGLTAIINSIRSMWKGKEMNQKVSQDIMSCSSRKYQLEQELKQIESNKSE